MVSSNNRISRSFPQTTKGETTKIGKALRYKICFMLEFYTDERVITFHVTEKISPELQTSLREKLHSDISVITIVHFAGDSQAMHVAINPAIARKRNLMGKTLDDIACILLNTLITQKMSALGSQESTIKVEQVIPSKNSKSSTPIPGSSDEYQQWLRYEFGPDDDYDYDDDDDNDDFE